MNTAEYRRIELQATDYALEGYKRSIKIYSTHGLTKCLDITEAEYKMIKKILLDSKEE